MYTVDYFIKKFEAIPEEKWCVSKLVSDDGSQRCARGHCGLNTIFNESIEDNALGMLFSPNCYGTGSNMVAGINNGRDSRYPQPTPKQRILAALHDIKKMQEPEVKPEVKPEPKYRVIKVSETLFDHNLIEAN